MQSNSREKRSIRNIEHTTIPMADGVKLAARIWLPEDAEERPVPAILEYIPYRKRDFTRARDETMHPWIAEHGYACVRVDLRGSGDSDGVLEDEYLPLELDDGVAVIAWLADQPWCDGNVGMIGISWGGFNGLQLAARQPPALKAVVTVSSTDDRYADDVHYMGGCLLGDNLSWASVMFAYNSLPPDPRLVGDKWRDLWIQRLDGSGLWLEKWLEHQQRSDYWRHGSVCEDFSAVQCPVMAVSGWADGYTNSVFRLLANLEVPRLGLVGPWSHKYPHLGEPGPAINFQQELLRWWDRWLKNSDTGIDREPRLRAWIQDSVDPRPQYRHRPGRWVAEDQWPSDNVRSRAYRLELSRLVPEQEAGEANDAALTVQSPLSVGYFAGKWCSYAAGPDLPYEQRDDEGGSLVFDTDPLESDLTLLGAPEMELEVSCNKPVGMISVRLSDVAPDGKATRCTYALYNLNHRESDERPRLLEPHKRYRIQVQLNDLGHVFPKGNSLRIAVSSSYWPLAWPSPQPAQLTLYTGGCRLLVPERSAREADREVAFEEAGEPARIPWTRLEHGEHRWVVRRDLLTDQSTLEVIKDEGQYRIEDIDLDVTDSTRELYSHTGDDFESVRGEVRAVRRLQREGWDIYTRTRTILTSDRDNFYIQAELDAYEDGKRAYSRNWFRSVPRSYL